ncbi:MAG: nucleotide excision repair endonuclease, partial [Pseudobdellovibrionaceae bacterium]
LPKKPGVYRMLSKWDQVLYVGKATNLHERVNSYFRGQKNRDPRKLEMLTQVWNLKVTPLNSPLEAALLETDEIKRLDPPYNICLKTGRRSLFFFNRSFTSISEESSEEHCMGPFSNAMVLDSMLRLSHSLQTGEFDQNLFFDPLDSSLLKEGFEIFCDRHHLNPDSFCSVRAILALGLQWFRQMKKLPEIENEIFDESEGDSAVDEFEDSLEEVELTAPDIADKFERHFIRSAKAYLRAKKLSQLLNSDIHFEIKPQLQGFLKIRRGQIVNEEKEQNYSSTPWAHLSIETYDRMTVLFTELEKIRAQNKMISITRIRS